MIVEIDIDKLVKTGIDINQYLFCQFIYQQSNPELEQYLKVFGQFYSRDSIDLIRSLGYLDFKKEELGYRLGNMYVTESFINEFVEKPIPSKLKNDDRIDVWIDEWFDLWPRGIKSGAYLVRGDRAGCLSKMLKFCKKNKEFSKDIIMKATKDYIDYCRLHNYKFMQCAHYFILKNDNSNLAAQCEAILHKQKTGEKDLMEVDNINDI